MALAVLKVWVDGHGRSLGISSLGTIQLGQCNLDGIYCGFSGKL